MTQAETYLRQILDEVGGKEGRFARSERRELYNKTFFNELKVAEKTQQFILNANLPLSSQRDVITVNAGGSVSKINAEYRVRATSDPGSYARLRSQRRGNYISGNVAEAGQGIRIPSQPQTTATAKLGYFLRLNGDITGIYFEYDKDDLWAVVEDNGTVITRKPSSAWSIWNPNIPVSQIMAQGRVLQIVFVYYGYGPIIWEMSKNTNILDYTADPVHAFKRNFATSLANPNLPLNVEVDGGADNEALDVFIGGRQFSTYGKTLPASRDSSAFRLSRTVGTTFVPVVSVRHKSGFENIQLFLNEVDSVTSSNMIYRIIKNGTLTNVNWANPAGFTPAEVATEYDIAATAITGGETIKQGFIGTGEKDQLTSLALPERNISEFDHHTLAVRAFTGTNETINLNLGAKELW